MERRILLVAGAAAGMSATFAAPVSAVMLGVELLLFEWRPRSVIPVAIASATAAVARQYLLPDSPLFEVPAHAGNIGPAAFLGCLLVGISAGLLALVLTAAVYASEDLFHRIPIHWMWWPAIGGVAIGAGGLVFPEALGVGYPVIEQLLSGDASMHLIIGVLIVKSAIWAISLGSGTSGGVLAPLLMIGSGVGALEGNFLPFEGQGFWPLVSMGAVLGGTMRSPLTGIVFVLELTHDVNSLLPVLVAVMVAHGFTVLTLRRSILTEKLSRRGLHLGREYSPDPLERALVKDVMRTNVATLPAEITVSTLALAARDRSHFGEEESLPVVDSEGAVVAILRGPDLRAILREPSPEDQTRSLADLRTTGVVVATTNETTRAVAETMARTGRTDLPVVDHASGRFVGMVSLRDILAVRGKGLEEEHVRERVFRVAWPRTSPGG